MDTYAKLRPIIDAERCACREVTGLLLVYLFTSNPIHCFRCRKEIDPEKLSLSSNETDQIANCFNVYRSLYNLWLDSGEYETWAKKQLIDPKGQVNLMGKAIAQELSKKWPTYYWWFYDTDDGVPAKCPSCEENLDSKVFFGTGKCDRCHVVI